MFSRCQHPSLSWWLTIPLTAAVLLLLPLHVQIFYGSALRLHIVLGQESLLQWVLHGLQAGVDTILTVRRLRLPAMSAPCRRWSAIFAQGWHCCCPARTVVNDLNTGAFCLLQVCTDLAAHRMPHDLDLYLGSPADDLAALAAPAWLATAREHPGKLQPLLAALPPLLQAKLDAAQQSQQVQRAGKPGRVACAAKAGGPFQSAAVKPRPDPQAEQRELSEAELTKQVRRLLQQLQRALPGQQAKRRQERTAAAFKEAEERAKRQRQ
jgi:hypothetical protein